MRNAVSLANDLKRKSVVIDADAKVITSSNQIQNKPIVLSPQAMLRKAALEKQEAEVTDFIRNQSDKLKKIKTGVIKARTKFRNSLYASLSGIYASYMDIEKSEHSGNFYATLRGYLINQDIRIQSNST